MLHELSRIKDRKTGRFSLWDTSGRNADSLRIEPGESFVLADKIFLPLPIHPFRP